MFRERVYYPGSGCYVSPKSLSRSRVLSGAVSDFDWSTSRRSTSSFHAVDVPVADLFCHKFVFTLFSWAARRGCRSVGNSSTFSPFSHYSVFLTWYAFALPLLLDSSLHFWNFSRFFIVTDISDPKYGETSIISLRLAPSLFILSCSPMNNAIHALYSAGNHADHQNPTPHKLHVCRYILNLNYLLN